MNARFFFTARRLPALLALGGLVLTGCFSDSGNNSSSDRAATLQGRVQGDNEGSSSGWEGTVITTHTIGADGSLGAARDSSNCGPDGRYTIETLHTGNQELIVRARRGDEEWMARFGGDLKADQTSQVRPLDLESTLEAAVWLELKKNSEGGEVHSSEVNLAIDAEASAESRGEYRGGDAARDALVSRLAAAVRAASQARKAFLEKADSLYASHQAAIDSARVRAQVEFDAALHAAVDTASARAAQRAYVKAMVDAYVRADVQRTTVARSAEASYHALVRATAQLSDSTRTAVARNYARLLAVACDTAMREEFRDAGAAQARLQLVIDAGARLRASVDTASTRARLDSAVVRFRSDVRAAFNDTADSSFNFLATILNNIAVTAILDSLSASIQSAISGTIQGAAIGEAYAESHLQARSELRSRFGAVNDDAKEAEAAANLTAFVTVRTGLD